MTQENISELDTQKLPQVGAKRKWGWIVLASILVIAWFALGIYLHRQAAQSRAKLERNRLEAQRRAEFKRQEAQYKYEWEQRTQTPRVRNVFNGR